MQQEYDVEIIRDAVKRQSAREEYDVPEKVYGVAGNQSVAKEETEAKVCS